MNTNLKKHLVHLILSLIKNKKHIMNKQLKKLYVCCENNEVIIFETNLTKFHKKIIDYKFKKFNKTYRQLDLIFKKHNILKFEDSEKKYTLQQLM
jgi:hypothetical protein